MWQKFGRSVGGGFVHGCVAGRAIHAQFRGARGLSTVAGGYSVAWTGARAVRRSAAAAAVQVPPTSRQVVGLIENPAPLSPTWARRGHLRGGQRSSCLGGHTWPAVAEKAAWRLASRMRVLVRHSTPRRWEPMCVSGTSIAGMWVLLSRSSAAGRSRASSFVQGVEVSRASAGARVWFGLRFSGPGLGSRSPNSALCVQLAKPERSSNDPRAGLLAVVVDF